MDVYVLPFKYRSKDKFLSARKTLTAIRNFEVYKAFIKANGLKSDHDILATEANIVKMHEGVKENLLFLSKVNNELMACLVNNKWGWVMALKYWTSKLLYNLKKDK